MSKLSIESISEQTRAEKSVYAPLIFDLSNDSDFVAVEELIGEGRIASIVDEYSEQMRELYFARNPEKISNKDIYTGQNKEKPLDLNGVWAYFSWRKTLVHCLPEKDFKELRLSRNFNLILPEEQSKLSNLKIAFAGLNVGNPGAICSALEGVGGEYRFADIDELSVSNLNRFRAGILDLGVNKAVLTARQVYEADPFAKVSVFENGITPSNIQEFLSGVDLLVEETDNLKIKLELRREALKMGIPVIMVTGDGPHIVLDVERYDLEKVKLLNGFISDELVSEIDKFDPAKASAKDRVILARDFIGEKFLSKRLNESFNSFGETLPSIPQLAESSFLRGSLLCNTIRKIFTPVHTIMSSGRYHIDLKNLSQNYEQ